MSITPWHRGTLVAYDTETTGVDPLVERIVTATLLIIDAATGDTREQHWLINPGIEIPEGATQVHGITTDHAREHGQDPLTALGEIRSALMAGWAHAPVVAYNASYDLTVTAAELARHGLPAIQVGYVLDPLVIDRAMDTYRPGSRKLTAVAGHYGVPLAAEDAHGSAADALAAARVAWMIAHRYPTIGEAELADLHEWQVAWHADWAEGFERWLSAHPERESMPIPRDWPVRAQVR